MVPHKMPHNLLQLGMPRTNTIAFLLIFLKTILIFIARYTQILFSSFYSLIDNIDMIEASTQKISSEWWSLLFFETDTILAMYN